MRQGGVARERNGVALAAVVEIAARALSPGDRAALWVSTVDAVSRALDASACALWELLPDGETLALRAATRRDPGLTTRVDLAASAGAREVAALRTGGPVAVGSGLAVPLPGDERAFGVLSVERAQSFDATDLHFLQAVAHVLAAATAPTRTEKEAGRAGGGLPPARTSIAREAGTDAEVAETRIGELARVEAAVGDGYGSRRAVPPLTPREQEVLALIAEGLTNAAIADRLGIGITTVRSHVRGVIEKLGVNSKLQAIVRASEQGLLHEARGAKRGLDEIRPN